MNVYFHFRRAAAMALLWSAAAAAQSWSGFVDRSTELEVDRFSFTGTNSEAGDSNDNYYDGDFADFDGDGRLDRGLISRYGLLWNTGGGTLTPVANTILGGTYHFGDKDAIGNDAVCWADVDGDGDPDSIQGGNGEALTLQTNQAGSFTIKWKKSGSSAKRIVKIDLERDGDVDLVVSGAFCLTRDCGQPDDFRVWVNDGTGQFTEQSAARGLAYASALIAGVSAGDIDGDGDFDLVLMSGTRRRGLALLNNGSGVFTEREFFTIPDSLWSYMEGGVELTVGMSGSDTTALGDIDGDGDLDLVAGALGPIGGHPNAFYGVFVNDGAGNFTEQAATRIDVGTFNGKLYAPEVKLADLDGDGDLDLAAYSQRAFADLQGHYLQIFLNDGSGRFTLASGLAPAFTPPVGSIHTFDVADVNGDGSLDLWLGNENGPVMLLVNTLADSSGLPVDQPRGLRVVGADAQGVRLSWRPPPSASNVRFYRLYRTLAPDLPIDDRPLIKTVALSAHADDGFVAPLTSTTTAAQLADPQVQLRADGSIEYLDATARPGIRYLYSVVHVGKETKASEPTPEVAATVPGQAGSDTTGPDLLIVSPTMQHWGAFPRIVLQYADAQSGVDPASLRVSFDAALGPPAGGGRPAGADVADLGITRDGSLFVAALQPPLQMPASTLVTMTASIADLAGNRTTRTARFFVSTSSPQLPTASFIATPTTGTAPLAVDFDGSASLDPDGKVVRYEWYFGDGAMATGRTARHVYGAGGTFNARLVVRDLQGGVGTTTRPLILQGPPAACSPGEVRACYSGPAGTEGIGACAGGSQSCASGMWQPCSGEVVPAAEVCGDSMDGDCDGVADDAEPDCQQPPRGCGCGAPGSASLIAALAFWRAFAARHRLGRSSAHPNERQKK